MTEFRGLPIRAGLKADALLAAEAVIQDKMWGVDNNRADALNGELRLAAMAQLMLVTLQTDGTPTDAAIATAKAAFYPENWDGFRDYGTRVANLVVAGAFIRSEIKRLIAAGEPFDRSNRDGSYPPRNAPNMSSAEAAGDGAKVDADAFLKGRAAYVEKVPVFEIATALNSMDDPQSIGFVTGYLDGVIQDVRVSAENSRTEINQRSFKE